MVPINPTARRSDTAPEHPDTTDETLDVFAVARRFAVSPRTIRRLAESQAIAHYRVGRRRLIRFRPEDIDEYLRRSRVSAVS